MASVDFGYYAYLAQTIPPAQLARAVAVRAGKILRSGVKLALDKSGAGPLLFEASPDERRRRARYALASPRPSLTEPLDRERTAALLRERFPAECAAVVREAEEALRGRLPIFGEMKDCSRAPADSDSGPAPVDLDSGPAAVDSDSGLAAVDYATDPIGHRVVYDVRTPGPSVNLFQPGADAKAAWEVGRLQHLWRYGQARWLAKTAAERSRWARAFISTVRQFRADCPAGQGVQWSCAMEVSVRAVHLALVFAYVQDDPVVGVDFLAELFDCIEEHCLFVEDHLEETGAVRTNHYASDLVGLVVAGALFPELPRARVWLRNHGRRLWEEIPRQCRADGTHFESSSGYQRLVAELFLVAALAARAGGAPAPRQVEACIAGLFRSLGEVLKPNGDMPQFGDLDSCRGLPLVPRTALDCSFLPALGAVALNDPSLKTDAPCPAEVAWLFGPAGVAHYDRLAAAAPAGSIHLKDAGIAILRFGDSYLCLTAGPNGQGGTGGHAHNDKNGVELSMGGHHLAVDRGTFVYARDPEERNARRGTAGHSTVQVDGAEQNRIVPGRLFALPDTAHARVLEVSRRDGFEVAIAEHHGYQRLSVLHRRVAALSPSAAVFADELFGSGEHAFDLRWFVPHTDLVQRAATAEERARLEVLHEKGFAFGFDAARCVAVRAGGKEIALFAFGATLPWQLSIMNTDVSPGYAERAEARLVSLHLEGEVPARLFTAVLVH